MPGVRFDWRRALVPIAGAVLGDRICGPLNGDLCCADAPTTMPESPCDYHEGQLPGIIQVTLTGLTTPYTKPTAIYSASVEDLPSLPFGELDTCPGAGTGQANYGSLDYAWAFGNSSFPVRFMGVYGGFGGDPRINSTDPNGCNTLDDDCRWAAYVHTTASMPVGRTIFTNHLGSSTVPVDTPGSAENCFNNCCANTVPGVMADGSLGFLFPRLRTFAQRVSTLRVPCDIDVLRFGCPLVSGNDQWFRRHLFDPCLGTFASTIGQWLPPYPVHYPLDPLDGDNPIANVPGYRIDLGLYRQITLFLPLDEPEEPSLNCCELEAHLLLHSIVTVRVWGESRTTSSGPPVGPVDESTRLIGQQTGSIHFLARTTLDLSGGIDGAAGEVFHHACHPTPPCAPSSFTAELSI